jgi:hypothetical protein
MEKKNKTRLNLYISRELVDFAKEWSYVTDVPISKMLEEYLKEKKELVQHVSPFQWLSDPVVNRALLKEDKYKNDLEEYLHNPEEEEFCRENPDHPRARIRQKLKREYERKVRVEMEKRKRKEKELIQRWMQSFPV